MYRHDNGVYNGIPPAGDGIQNGGVTDSAQDFTGQKTFAGGFDSVNGAQVNANSAPLSSGYVGYGIKDSGSLRFFIAFNPVENALKIRSRTDTGTARQEVIVIPRDNDVEIVVSRMLNTRGPLLFPAANSLSSSLSVISALDITGYSFIALTSASNITLNSFALSAALIASNVGFVIHMRIATNVICTIRHNVTAGGIAFICPNSVDYVIQATNKNRLYAISYCPIAGCFFVS